MVIKILLLCKINEHLLPQISRHSGDIGRPQSILTHAPQTEGNMLAFWMSGQRAKEDCWVAACGQPAHPSLARSGYWSDPERLGHPHPNGNLYVSPQWKGSPEGKSYGRIPTILVHE